MSSHNDSFAPTVCCWRQMFIAFKRLLAADRSRSHAAAHCKRPDLSDFLRITASPRRGTSRSFDRDSPPSDCWKFSARRSLSASTVVSDSELPKGAACARCGEEPARERVGFYSRVDLVLYHPKSKVSECKAYSIPLRDSASSRKRFLFKASRAGREAILR
ncbi:hypothetical protein FOL47_000472 [Perkinsus chesapeaki]|uniref:Uncharacterized protein n=1 Tax=Perkinsus chesapeaki TaxID=330153 RepID=A0A7J6MLL4_PERCH|nr:hypothetical protein FOL47_000472 [Perkinsus chesapeaki]